MPSTRANVNEAQTISMTTTDPQRRNSVERLRAKASQMTQAEITIGTPTNTRPITPTEGSLARPATIMPPHSAARPISRSRILIARRVIHQPVKANSTKAEAAIDDRKIM